MKQVTLFIFFAFILLSFASAQTQSIDPVKVGDCANLIQTCDNCTYVNITNVVRSGENSTIFTINDAMEKDGTFYNYTFCNTSIIADYIYSTVGDLDGITTVGNVNFEVTAYGKTNSISDILANFLLIGFLILVFIGVYNVGERTDFKKWNDSIIRQYQTRNFVKMVLSALVYNLMKNSYMIYYLIGLPIVMIITDMTYAYNLTGLIAFMNVFLFVYTIGIVIVGLVFLSYVQEWSMNMIDLVKDMNWGFK